LKDKYIELVVSYYLKEHSNIVIKDFIEETGIDRQVCVKYFRNNDNYEEKTIGVFVRKLY